MRRKLPKLFTTHPGIEEAEFSQDSDYKYEVFLREGWTYTSGRLTGIRTGFFHTVADFVQARPEQVAS